MASKRLVRTGLNMTLIGLTGLMAGCDSIPSMDSITSLGSSSKQIRVTTNPPGATVYANDKVLGVTPLTITPGNEWNTGFVTGKDVGMVYQYTGTISIKKPGCDTYTAEVSDPMLFNDIAIDLNCDPSYRPSARMPSGDDQTAPAYAPAGTPAYPADWETPEEIMARRLRRLEGLRSRGLITEDEYQDVRQRILNEL